jgi:hypothetical protein
MRRHALLRAFRKHGRGCMGRDTPGILRASSGTLQTPQWPQITGYPDPIALAAGEDTRVRTGDGDVRDAGERTHPPVYRGACTTNAWEMRAMSSLLPEPESPYRTPRFVRDDRCHVMGIVAACVVAASQPNVHQETAGGSGGLTHQPPGVSACSSLCRQQRAPGRSYSTASCNRGIPSRCRSECVAILSHLGRNCRWACYHNTPRQRSHTDVAVLPGILSRGCSLAFRRDWDGCYDDPIPITRTRAIR